MTHMRLSEAIEKYLDARETRYAVTTVKNERLFLTRFLLWHGDVQVRNMRPERVEQFFIEIRKPHKTRDGVSRPPVTPATYNYDRSRLLGLFTWCTRRGLLKADLLAEVSRMRNETKRRLQPGPEVLATLHEYADNPRDRAFIALLCNTGFRRLTALSLRAKDIDLEHGWIHARITKTAVQDQFPISGDLAPELHRWLHRYALDLGRPLTGQEHLFPGRTTGGFAAGFDVAADGTRSRKRTPGRWVPEAPAVKTTEAVNRAMRRAGVDVPKGSGCHTLRRGLARALFDQLSAEGHDAAIRAVGSVLHHASAATTEIYLGLDSETERRNTLMRGRPLLSAMVQREDAQVVNLR